MGTTLGNFNNLTHLYGLYNYLNISTRVCFLKIFVNMRTA
jgi:hypothetical protein